MVVFRNIFEGGIRDHAVITFNDADDPGRAAPCHVDDWQIAACPHHGPSLAITQSGTYHVSWFTNGKARKGLFYAYSRDGGKTSRRRCRSARRRKTRRGRYVLAGPHGLALAWKEFDGERTTVKLMMSVDDGETWCKPKSIADDVGYVRSSAAGERRPDEPICPG